MFCVEEPFDETKIRKELKRLDDITGFNAAKLPIKLGNGKSTLGRFKYSNNGALEFYFSNHYFLDSNFPVEEKLDTIRHEYAHYMDYMMTGHSSHGNNWKRCCRIVGAFPSRYFSHERADSFMEKHKKEDATNKILDNYHTGITISHPQYGDGTITGVFNQGLSRYATVKFDLNNEKKLSLLWISEKCLKY